MIDKQMSLLLADFFLDLSKAVCITTFITPSIAGLYSIDEIAVALIKGLLNVILLLVIAWKLSLYKEQSI